MKPFSRRQTLEKIRAFLNLLFKTLKTVFSLLFLRYLKLLCRLMSPLGKDETRHNGSNSFIVVLSLNHYLFCETMSRRALT